MNPDALRIRGLTVERRGRRILTDIGFTVPRGVVVGVIGPNGAGKSTLLSCLYRHTPYRQGEIIIEDRELRSLPRKEIARLIAAVPQDTPIAFDLTVSDIVAAGRIPHSGALVHSGKRDREIIEHCLRRVNLEQLRHRSVATLSGGERQRALLGRALAQQAPILVLDEPTNHLDLANQEQLLELVHEHTGTGVIALHDLNLAAEYCDRIVVMNYGSVVATGTPGEVLTPTLLHEVFRVRARVVPHPESGRPHIITRARRSVHIGQ
ncbi:ABC transporter ATP-binding protein [Amycolatopsis pithecellobii]|uniref:ATP-binding cassette domain-containing protein n=1 Tax=Amycolatopsis pithecellobii TaxID=664692 RepID=A0A6N7Z224_9PSEU|nr:ABC transporter ATP-binding protein [Amycolatopsis pithecellobii]MTD52636.1 ATP-binding cassette domain-containing protein [Amycolatopsis pithecellobii]